MDKGALKDDIFNDHACLIPYKFNLVTSVNGHLNKIEDNNSHG